MKITQIYTYFHIETLNLYPGLLNVDLFNTQISLYAGKSAGDVVLLVYIGGDVHVLLILLTTCLFLLQ